MRAVALSVIVTGSAPQSKVTTPPLATAATTASEVQLAGVPLPTTVVGRDVSRAWPDAGTAQPPAGLPAAGAPPPAAGAGAGAGESAGAPSLLGLGAASLPPPPQAATTAAVMHNSQTDERVFMLVRFVPMHAG
jgi:hypothetical protein